MSRIIYQNTRLQFCYQYIDRQIASVSKVYSESNLNGSTIRIVSWQVKHFSMIQVPPFFKLLALEFGNVKNLTMYWLLDIQTQILLKNQPNFLLHYL